jgi:anaerobic selenocysteine-containing dehydrogenase
LAKSNNLEKAGFMSKKTNSQRRDFLKLTAAGAAGLAIASPVQKAFAATARTAAGTAPLNKWPGKVVINFNNTIATGDVDPTAEQITTIQTMVNDSILLLTGQTDLGAAWKSIFPATGANAITATSKITIKVPVGCSKTRSVPHWWPVQAITNGLQKMDFNGTKFPAANITIYDAA